jgi:hypothetical protein
MVHGCECSYPCRHCCGAPGPDATAIDGPSRAQWVRRAKDIIAAHLSDLGGEDNTSEAERSIIRRASVLTVELERLETKFALVARATRWRID